MWLNWRMKKLCWTLLLLLLSPRVCAAAFGVNVTQRHYQAEESHSITLEWTFTTDPHRPWTLLHVLCGLRTGHNISVLIEFSHDGDELTEFVGEQFAGRVQMDREALREGGISLHVSRLRTEDSGWYRCEVRTDQGSGSESCRLNVTAAADHPEPQRPTQGPGPDIIEWMIYYIGVVQKVLIVGVSTVIVFIVVILRLRSLFAPKRKTKNKSDIQENVQLNQPATDSVCQYPES